MSKTFAYAGRILKADLSTKTFSQYPFSKEERRLYLGGKIMAAKIIHDLLFKDNNKVPPTLKGAEFALSKDNVIVVSTGPLTGVGSPCSSRFNISSISPLTGILASSNCGGNFGMQLKRAGYDALVIVGKSDSPVHISITEDTASFEDATHLYGLNISPTQEKLGGGSGKLVIGPAGENLVKYALVASGERRAGRGGIGAVFGSKNLKAVTVIGKKKMEVAHKKKLKKINVDWSKRLIKHPLSKPLPRLGTAGLLTKMHAHNMLATRNFKKGNYEDYDMISGETLAETHLVKNGGCATCPLKCARIVNVDGKDVKGPELQTITLLGSNILNNDLEKINKWNHVLDELGMDTISCAGTIAFAMELNEKGLWNNGLDFGKTDDLEKIMEDIAYRRGIGADLAEGSRFLSEKYGGKEFCINVKGMELAGYDPRGAVGQGLGYATSNRGGCHLNGGYLVLLEGMGLQIDPHTDSGKANFIALFQNTLESVSAGGSCLFSSYLVIPPIILKKPNGILTRFVNKAIPHMGWLIYLVLKYPQLLSFNLKSILPHPAAISAATGFKFTSNEFIRIGERGFNLERFINTKLGITSEDDTLPKRFESVPIEKMKAHYYKCRGWDEKGVPKEKLLKKLKILN